MTARPHLLHQLVEAHATSADALAVTDGDESLDAGTLQHRLAQMAALLQELGVRPGDRVGIQLHCSVRAMVAVHGVLHAGGVVVPLDPDAPPAYVADLVRRCAVDTVVTQLPAARLTPLTEAGVRNLVAAGPIDGVRTLTWDDLERLDPIAPAHRTGDDPAYVIWTSGSTGRPKGIVHTHRSGLRCAELTVDTYGLDPDDRLACSAPLHFDQSIFQLYAAPGAGAASVMLPAPVLRFPASVTARLADLGVTAWYSVPSLLVQLARRGALDERDLSAMRWVLFGGEVFPAGQLAELMRLVPSARFSNVYGPAEVNQCTFHHLDVPPAGDALVPIGRAWADTELRVVDTDGYDVRDGAGELWVRSATAMAGYWDDEAATEAAFRTVDGPGGLTQRWYATGDLVELDERGALVFLGRRDHQVKIRGHRIELESVESALAELPGVAEAAVVPERLDDGDRLSGLVVAEVPVDPADLVARLRTLLPPYAVPHRIRVVAHLPRTSTAKIDRSAAAALLADLDDDALMETP
ncbi:MAG: amino acid adenylation domain-containing protein [Actinomycetota bacterium]